YLKDTTLRVHHGRAGRSGEVLQRERNHVRVAQGTTDALNVGGHKVSRYELAVGSAFVARAYASLEAELCARLCLRMFGGHTTPLRAFYESEDQYNVGWAFGSLRSSVIRARPG